MSNVSCKAELSNSRTYDDWLFGDEIVNGSFVFLNAAGELAESGDEDCMMFHAPNGCWTGKLPLRRQGAPRTRHPEWEWNGNRESPTLSPSVEVNGGTQWSWHGYLRDGQWEGCQ